MAQFLERWQVPLYVLAMAVGAGLGWFAPGQGKALGPVVTPLLALLLYVTFLGMPLRSLAPALRGHRFLWCVLAVDLVLAPATVLLLVTVSGLHGPLLLGAALVLLAPCVDYVIVFTGLAGGAAARLLAVTPLLLLLQLVLLPVGLWWLLGEDAALAVPWAPALGACLAVVVFPLAAAALTQWATPQGSLAHTRERVADTAMVPLMVLTLTAVVAGQAAEVGSRAAQLLPLVPLYAGFAALMTGLGWCAGRVARLPVAERRAVVFTGVTRNSLVVLPVALAVSGGSALVPLAVVTQTLVELVVMVVLVAAVPRLVPAPRP